MSWVYKIYFTCAILFRGGSTEIFNWSKSNIRMKKIILKFNFNSKNPALQVYKSIVYKSKYNQLNLLKVSKVKVSLCKKISCWTPDVTQMLNNKVTKVSRRLSVSILDRPDHRFDFYCIWHPKFTWHQYIFRFSDIYNMWNVKKSHVILNVISQVKNSHRDCR